MGGKKTAVKEAKAEIATARTIIAEAKKTIAEQKDLISAAKRRVCASLQTRWLEGGGVELYRIKVRSFANSAFTVISPSTRARSSE